MPESNNAAISTNENLIKLLQFQDRFINLVHSQVYSHQILTEKDILMFQVNHITDLNEVWNSMVAQLTSALVDQQSPYDNMLRDYFQKVMNLDYFPLLRVNRYQATQLSLFGFDIYVAPLSVLLEIINRMDGIKHSLFHMQQPQQSDYKDAWECLSRGWNCFMYSSLLSRLSFNIYLFKEYLKIGAKSLPKKDKEIVFTGCNNLFTGLVQLLKDSGQIWILVELSELVNELYCFHPSYTYEYFFTLLLPVQNEYEPIFKAVEFVGEKCMNANIVTPLLFGILRQYDAFMAFISQAEDECWVRYLQAVVYGLVINFKARILEYEEAMNMLRLAMNKLGLLGYLNLSFLPGDLGKEWGEAREFFISALHVGYNFGSLQTWHIIKEVQPKLIQYARDALLMLPDPNPQEMKTLMGSIEPCELLIQQLEQLTQTAITMEQFTTTFSDQVLQGTKQPLPSKHTIIMLSNVVKMCQLQTNIHVVNYMIKFLVKANFERGERRGRVAEVSSQGGILDRRLQVLGDYYLQQASLIHKNSDVTQSFILKQTVLEYCYSYYRTGQDEGMFAMLFQMCDGKQALQSIFHILDTHHVINAENDTSDARGDENQQFDDTSQLIAACIISKYLPTDVATQCDVLSLKTFSKQYLVPKKLINLDSRLHVCMGNLIQKVLWSEGSLAARLSELVLLKIVVARPWVAVPLLGFPVSFSYHHISSQETNQHLKFEAFSSWLIKGNKQSNRHNHLLLLLGQAQTASQSLQTWPPPTMPEYINEICNLSVCQQIIGQVNCNVQEVSKLEDESIYIDIIRLLQLVWKVLHRYCSPIKAPTTRFYRKMLKLYLMVFTKLGNYLTQETTENYKDLDILLSSLANTYYPLLEKLYSQKVKVWRIYIQKLCYISSGEQVQGLSRRILRMLTKQCQLRSVKRDTDYLIQSSIDYLQECQHSKVAKKSLPSQLQLDQIREQISSAWPNYRSVMQQRDWALESQWQAIWEPNAQTIRAMRLDQVQESLRCKDYVLPIVSAKSIQKIMEYLENTKNSNSLFCRYKEKVVGLLSMNVDNHQKVAEWCIKTKNRSLLSSIGISKRLANSLLPQILNCLLHASKSGSTDSEGLSHRYIQALCRPLDENSKQLLSDSFNIAAYQKQSSKLIIGIILTSLDQRNQISNDNLSFLLTYSSSNWRYTIDWLSAHICSPTINSNLHVNSMASLVLQYLEYLRITGMSNKDYEERIENYTKLLTGYSYMLMQKCSHIFKLEQDNLINDIKEQPHSTERSTSSLSSYSVDLQSENGQEQKPPRLGRHQIQLITTVISQQQINLYYANELASIKVIVDSAELKEILCRIASFKRQSNENLMIKDQQALACTINRFDGIISSAILINCCARCLGEALGGQVLIPDFLHHFRFCNSEVLSRFQIELGIAIEQYYNQVKGISIKGQVDKEQLPALDLFERRPYKHSMLLRQFVQTYSLSALNVEDYQPVPEDLVIFADSRALTPQFKQQLSERCNRIVSYLGSREDFTVQDGKIDFNFESSQDLQNIEELNQSDQSDNIKIYLFRYLGVLYTCLGKPVDLGPILLAAYNRQKLSYEILKHYQPEVYHQIKSILIDSDLNERKKTFMYQNKQLVHDGSNVHVTLVNREIYCNLLAKASLGSKCLKATENFVRGVNSFVD